MDDENNTVILCDPNKLKDEILKIVLAKLDEEIDRLNAHMKAHIEKEDEERLERNVEYERHAQAVECFLENMNSILDKRL